MNIKLLTVIVSLIALLVIGYLTSSKISLQNSAQLPIQNLTPTQAYRAPTEVKATPGYKTFKSTEKMNFTLQIPVEYSTTEKLTHLEIKKEEDSISGDRIGVGVYNSIEDYLSYFDKKSELKDITVIKKMEIDGYPAIVRQELRGGIYYRIYYILVDPWIYGFSTKSESLYSDLDQIVQSFKYQP